MSRSIVHLSDLHLGAEHSDSRMITLIRNLCRRFPERPRPVVLISGDLVNQPFGSMYDRMERYLVQLRSEEFPVLVVPGNHDYGMGFFNWPPCERAFRKKFLHSDTTSYPVLDIIDDIAFIGLDTSAAELHWFDFLGPNGEIGSAQMRRLSALLSDPRVVDTRHRVLYMHHHPNDSGSFMGLKDWHPLHQLIDKPGLFSAVLFGHRHLVVPEGKAASRPLQHIPRVYDAGASLGKKGYPQGPHRLIDLDADPATDTDLRLLEG